MPFGASGGGFVGDSNERPPQTPALPSPKDNSGVNSASQLRPPEVERGGSPPPINLLLQLGPAIRYGVALEFLAELGQVAGDDLFVLFP